MKWQLGVLLVLGLTLAGMVQAQEGEGQDGQGPGRGRGMRKGGGDGPEGMGRPQHPPPPLLVALDTNKDHEISAEEIANASEALKALDKNGDGKLTMEELRPRMADEGDGADQRPGRGPFKGPGDGDQNGKRRGPPMGNQPEGGAGQGGDQGNQEGGMGRHHPPPPPLIAALDADHDRKISADEIAGAADALKELDKNGDGELTPEELRPMPPPDGEKGGFVPPGHRRGGPGNGNGPHQNGAAPVQNNF